MRFLVFVLPLAGCSLLNWDDLTQGGGGGAAATGGAGGQGGTGGAGAAACVSDETASAVSLSLDDGVHCYRRVHEGLQWGLADLECANTFGGHLLIIDDIDEFSVHAALYPDDCPAVTSACSDEPEEPSDSRCDDRAWIGAQFVDDEPVWVSGAPWTWPETVFASGEPNERTDPITLRTEQLLDERAPRCPHAFICEIDP